MALSTTANFPLLLPPPVRPLILDQPVSWPNPRPHHPVIEADRVRIEDFNLGLDSIDDRELDLDDSEV